MEREYIDAMQRKVVLKSNVGRVVVLCPGVDVILQNLGLGEKIVGTTYCCEKSRVIGKSVIKGFTDSSLQDVLKTKSDVVFHSARCQKGWIKKAEEKNVKLFVYHPLTVDEVFTQTLQIGEILGVIDKAEQLVLQCKDRINKIKNNLADIPARSIVRALVTLKYPFEGKESHSPLGFLNKEGAPVMEKIESSGEESEFRIIGGKTLVGLVLKEAFTTNIFEGYKIVYPKVNWKDVIQRNPSVIIVCYHNLDCDKEYCNCTNKSVEISKASIFEDIRLAVGKDKKIILIPDKILFNISPTSICNVIEGVAKAIYPEKFEGEKELQVTGIDVKEAILKPRKKLKEEKAK